MTSNEKIFNQYVRHQTLVLRYARGLSKQASSVIARTEKELEKAILSAANSAPSRTLTDRAGRNWNSSFEQDIGEIRQDAWDEVIALADSDLKSFAASEALISATIIDGAVPAILNLSLPPQSQLNSIVNSQPFEGRTLKQWLQGSSRTDVQRILNKTKVGIIQGLSPADITKSVMGTKSYNFKDGVARKAFRDIESIVLTTSNGIQHEAKQALYKANSDVVEKEVYVATLDARTTLVCASNDGKRFLPGEGPMPPLHFRCRSLRVPDIDPDLLTTRGVDPTTEKQLLDEYNKQEGLDAKSRSSLPRGHKGAFDKFSQKRKRELIGTVPGGVTYNDWLKTQSNAFQNEVLGPTRAKLFREGGLHLDKFVARDGDIFTLDELRVKGLDLDLDLGSDISLKKLKRISDFDVSDFKSASASISSTKKAYTNNLDYLKTLDPSIVGRSSWPDLDRISNKDVDKLISDLDLIIINSAPGGKPLRYINAANKRLSQYKDPNSAIKPVPIKNKTPTPKTIRPSTVSPSVPIKAKTNADRGNYEINISHDKALSQSERLHLENMAQQGLDLFPEKYRHLVSGTQMETIKNKTKAAAFSFRDKYVTLNTGIVDPDYITHELFHVLDDKFSINMVKSSLSWRTGDPILDDLAKKAKREFVLRKSGGISKGKLSGGNVINYHNGDWDDWYEAAQYLDEKVSPEYLTVGAQRYITRTPEIELNMRDKQPALFELLQYLYEDNDI